MFKVIKYKPSLKLSESKLISFFPINKLVVFNDSILPKILVIKIVTLLILFKTSILMAVFELEGLGKTSET